MTVICDCERSHNGLGLSGRECDCEQPIAVDKLPEWSLVKAREIVAKRFKQFETIIFSGAMDAIEPDIYDIARALAETDIAAIKRATQILWNMRKPFVLHGRDVEADILNKAEIAVSQGLKQ